MPRIYCRQVRSRGLRPDWDEVIKEVEREIDTRIKPDLLGYFNRIVASWKPEHKPAFRARKYITREYIKLHVYPTGPGKKLWQWLSVTGTKEHDITPRIAKWLTFVWGGPRSYKAKTTRSGGYKGPGIATGHVRKFKAVKHPGFKPRNIEKWVARWYNKRFYRYIGNAFRRGIYKARSRATR